MKFKPIFILSVLLLGGLLQFGGCKDDTGEPAFLTIDDKKITLGTEADSRNIPVKTNVDDWTAHAVGESAGWIVATRHGSSLRINISANDGRDTRKGEVKVVAGNLSETIEVEQLGIAPAILLSSEIFTLSPNGGDVRVEITSNIEYDILIPEDGAWIKPKPAARIGDMIKTSYEYSVSWNSLDSERRAEISVRQKDGGLEKKILVIQKAQSGYTGNSSNDIQDDIRVKVSGGYASSFQPGGEIEKSFDGEMNTLYHSLWANSGADYFPITIEYYFENQESVDYLIYHPRTSGGNGHFKETEIWVKTEDNPTLAKLMDYDFKGSGSATRVTFDKPLVKPTTVRFVIKSGAGDGQGFASCAEMEFYRINPDNTDPLTLFSDMTATALKAGITLEDIEKVSNNLYRNMALYMYRGTYPREFRIANYKAYPHPDVWARENKTSQLSLLDNPTGIRANKDDELIVFVGETGNYPLSIKIQNLNLPGADGYNNASFYPLTKGMNKIKAKNKGLVYLFYHTADYKTAPEITIHFATGKVNGYYDSQKHKASDWSKYLNAATDDYFDVIGEYAHLTFPTSAFKSYAANNGHKLIEYYDDLCRLEREFMGIFKYDRPTVNRNYFHVMYTSFMYATSYRTAYHVGTMEDVANPDNLRASPWGPAHEVGHTFQTRPGFRWLGMTEVTNNVHSLYVQTQWGNPSRLESENMGRYNNRYEKAYHSFFVKNTTHPAEDDVFCKLVSLWQLQLYFANAKGEADTYKDLYEKIRVSPDKPNAGEQQLEFVKNMSEITKTDLTGFFQKWGYLTPVDMEIDDYGKERIKITQKQVDDLVGEIKSKGYSELKDKAEYICDSNWEIFKNKLPVSAGTAVKSGATLTMSNWKNVVAYEAYEDDNLIFVSNRSSFKLDNSATEKTKVYAIAYDGHKTEVNF